MLATFKTYEMIQESIQLIFDEDSINLGTDLMKFLNDLDANLEELVDNAILSRLEEILIIQGLNVIEKKVHFGNYKIFIELNSKVYNITVNKHRKKILKLEECYKPTLLRTDFNEGILGDIGSFTNLKDLTKELKTYDKNKQTSLLFNNVNALEISYLVDDVVLIGNIEEIKDKLMNIMITNNFYIVEFPYNEHLYEGTLKDDLIIKKLY